jgi:hypothetical protein
MGYEEEGVGSAWSDGEIPLDGGAEPEVTLRHCPEEQVCPRQEAASDFAT